MNERMDEQEFRQIIAEELNRLEPPDTLWNNIEKRGLRMNETKKKGWLTGIGIAAAAAVVIMTTVPGLMDRINGGLGATPPLPPGASDPSGSNLAMFLRLNDQYYWNSYTDIAESKLGDVVITVQRFVTEQDRPHQNGDSNMPQTGAEVRAIKGVDPTKSVAVQMGESLWQVFDAGPGPVDFQGSESPTEQDVVTSDHLQVLPPKITGAGRTNLMLEGKVRAPEGRFKAELWSGGKLIAEEWISAEGAAPDFAHFNWGIRVDAGIPDGTEVRYLVPVSPGGALDTELILPVR